MLTLKDDDRSKLNAAIDEARTRTSARLELQVVHLTDRYALYPVAYGAFAALILVGLLALVDSELALRDAFAFAVVLFVLVSLTLEWVPLKLLLVPRRQKHLRAMQMAHRAFAARILAAQERREGMLIFVALGERYVELVTDDALDRSIGQPTWDRIVKNLTADARRGDLAKGLLDAVKECGTVLAQRFPN